MATETGYKPWTDSEIRRLAELEGLINPRVGSALAMLAGFVPPEQVIVEIGSYKGKSTCYLASQRSHVYAVDAWDTPGNVTGRFGFADPETFEAFERQVAKFDLEDRITPIKGFSTEVAELWDQGDAAIGLLFIDGDHGESTSTSPLDDFNAWRPHLAPTGAIVVFDDWDRQHPSVVEAVEHLKSAQALRFERLAKRLAVARVTHA